MVKFWKPISVVLGAVVLTATAYGSWETIRPYATRAEYAQVNQRSCENRMSFLSQELRDVERRMADAQAQNNQPWLRTLIEQRQLFSAKSKE